jgi:membrane protease YdiL (CAAX protease family)
VRAALGPLRAALLVSAAFALIHGYPVTLFPVFTLALVLIWLLEVSRSLWVPMLAHALFNGLSIALIIRGAEAPL